MADNVAITEGSGTTIATEDVSGVQHQKVKIEFGGDGVATLVSSSDPLPVDGSGVTQPVSGTVTANLSTTDNTVLDNIDADTSAIQTATEAIQASLETAGGQVVNLGTNNDVTVTSGAITETNSTAILADTANIDTNVGTIAGDTTSIDGKTPALGQALAAASVPVVLPATQITTLTPQTDALTDTQLRASAVPVSFTGSGDVATQTTLAAINAKITAVNTGAVVVSSSALPSGASTEAKQPALGTAGTASSDVLTVQGIASMTALKVDGSAVTQPVSLASVPSHAVTNAGTFAVQSTLQTGSNVIGALTANQSVNVAQINGVATTMGNGASGTGVQRVTIASDSTGQVKLAAGTAGIGKLTANSGVDIGDVDVTSLTGSTIAHDGADSGNPHKIGGRAVSSEISAVANNDRTDFVSTLTGKQITHPYTNPENIVSGAITTAMTGTTSTSLIAATGSASLRNYITTIIVSNSHATVGTDVVIQDGSGGTTLMTIPAAAVYGGAVINLPVPLRQPTANTAIYCANVTTGASTKVSAVGYKAA